MATGKRKLDHYVRLRKKRKRKLMDVNNLIQSLSWKSLRSSSSSSKSICSCSSKRFSSSTMYLLKILLIIYLCININLNDNNICYAASINLKNGELVPVMNLTEKTFDESKFINVEDEDDCSEKCLCLGEKVYCSLKNLNKIPDDLPKWTEDLYLSNNSIKNINMRKFKNLLALRIIDLNKNRLRNLNQHLFINNSKLEKLELKYNHLTNIPLLNNLFNLEYLYLDYNHITSLQINKQKLLLTTKSFDSITVSSSSSSQQSPQSSSSSFASSLSPSTSSSSSSNINNNNIPNSLSLEEIYPRIKDLRLSHNQIKVVKKNNFLISKTLIQLNLNHNEIDRLEIGCFDNLTNLELLKLSNNRITKIYKSTFKGLNNLRLLDLSRNYLTYIDGLTFFGLTSLIELRLKRNKINYLYDAAFWELSSLERLTLEQNELTDIRKGWLYGLQQLLELNLNLNNIKIIDGDSFEFTPNLMKLNLNNNQLKFINVNTFHYLQNLFNLTLENNFIKYIDENTFSTLKSLKILNLNKNLLSLIIEDNNDMIFNGLNNLNELYLNENNLKYISMNVFKSLSSLNKLSLLGNQIQTIEFYHENNNKEDHYLSNLQELIMNTSNLNCDCLLKSLLKLIKSDDKKKAKLFLIGENYCKYPKNLNGKSFTELNVNQLFCEDLMKPFVIVSPQTQIAVKNSNLTLFCKVITSSDTRVLFQWKRNHDILSSSTASDDDSIDGDHVDDRQYHFNHRLTNIGELNHQHRIKHEVLAHYSNNSLNEYTSILTIINVDFTDEGKYQCIASNDIGRVYSNKANISVNILPKFIKTPLNISIKVGSTAKFECAAIGQPLPEISWQKDGGNDFPAARERRVTISSNTRSSHHAIDNLPSDDVFLIVSVKLTDNGIYTCTASNAAGKVSVSARLIVTETIQSPRKLSNINNNNINYNRQDNKNNVIKEKKVKVGETAAFECKTKHINLKKNITWSKFGKQLEFNGRFFLTPDDQLLVIPDVTKDDEGVYRCEYVNDDGLNQSIIYLKVDDKDSDLNENEHYLNITKKEKEFNESNGIDDNNNNYYTNSLSKLFCDNQTIGIIIICVVSCIVITSFVWVIVIYKTRKRGEY